MVSTQLVAYISGVIKAYSNTLYTTGSWYFNNKLSNPRLDWREKNSSS